tara:strand:+ start:343 stop:642 length:300 start_codon:yes stop_codon:yes gene_type:complete
MKLTESQLRRIIRHVLAEQVLGYTPPQQSGKDTGYMAFGDISSPVSPKPDPEEDPEDYEQLETQKQTLTKQRQDATNKGDAAQSNYDGQILRRLSQATG